MSHRAGPRSRHLRRRDVPRLQDLQRGDQLALEERAPPPVIGERRERLDHRLLAAAHAVGALQPPDGRDDLLLDAVGPLDPVEDAGVLAQGVPAVADAAVGDGGAEIFPDRLGELGLVAVTADDLGIVAHAAEGRVEHLRPDPLRERAAPEAADPRFQPRVAG